MGTSKFAVPDNALAGRPAPKFERMNVFTVTIPVGTVHYLSLVKREEASRLCKTRRSDTRGSGLLVEGYLLFFG